MQRTISRALCPALAVATCSVVLALSGDPAMAAIGAVPRSGQPQQTISPAPRPGGPAAGPGAAPGAGPVSPTGGPVGAAPTPNLTRAPSPLLGYGLMIVLLAAVVAISFMPSKRGHQD
jgi:hypothetical protein